MRYIVLSLLLLIQPAQAEVDVFAHAKDIARVEQYLSNITTLKAEFMQVAPSGDVASGVFYMAKPGKMRWQYRPPTPILLVSDGDTLTYFDAELDQVNYVSIDETLAGFFAQENMRLNSDGTKLVAFTAEDKVIRATIQKRGDPEQGDLTLEFTDGPLDLRGFTVSDAAGNMTRISMEDAEYGMPLDEGLFEFDDPRGIQRRGVRR